MIDVFSEGNFSASNNAASMRFVTGNSAAAGTDGGLSVAKEAVIGDDLLLLSDSAVLKFGTD